MHDTTSKPKGKEGLLVYDATDKTRPYELIVISSNLADNELQTCMAKVTKVLAEAEATVHKTADPMRARLAYPIQKMRQGVYHFIRFTAHPSKIRDISRDLRLVPDILRVQMDALASIDQKSQVSAPPAEPVKSQRGWTTRSPSTPSEQAKEAPAAVLVVPEATVPAAATEKEEPSQETNTIQPKEEPQVTMEDLDKRLGEILGQ